MDSFKIHPANDDIVIENGRIVMMSGGLEDSQSVWLRLRTWEGEWYFNPARGIPYERYWQKGYPMQMIYGDFLQELYNDSRIQQVLRLEVKDIDIKNRAIVADFEARLNNGDLIESTRVVRI